MKRTVAIAAAIILALLPLVASGEEETESRFEQALVQKGTLISKEFVDCGSFETELSSMNSGSMNFDIRLQTAVLTDIESNEKYYALRLVTTDYKGGDFVESVGVLDADEIDEVIVTLEYIQEHHGEMKNYSEIVYTATSGLVVGAYKSEKGEGLTVKLNATSATSVEMDKLADVISAFEEARDKLVALQ